MEWTEEDKGRLLQCTTLDEAVKEFPSVKATTLDRNMRRWREKAESTVDDFHEFLTRGRTAQEIGTKFNLRPEEVEMWIDREYEGYTLYTQRNAFNEKVYLYLPNESRKIRLKDPVFARHCSATPWIKVQFPDNDWKRLDIVPLYDVHYGHHACMVDKWREYIEFIRTTPNVFTFLGGDLIENSSKLSVAGGVYEQVLTPDQQITNVIEILRPIAHKVMFSIPGNHEDRAMKHMGIDVGRVIADALEVPYYDEPVSFDLSWKGYTWRGHAQHGASSSQTKGGKLNAARKILTAFGDFTHVNFSGHVHDPIANEESAIIRNYETSELEIRKRFTIIMPSFMGYFGTYGSRMGWAPPATGSVRFSMYGNGDYHIGS